MFNPHENLSDKIEWWVKGFVVLAIGLGFAMLLFAAAYVILFK